MFFLFSLELNYKEIIEQSLADLVNKIDVKNTSLWETLIELGLFTSGDVEYIKVSTGSILLYGRD